MVAEDDPGLREVLLHVLHEAGYQVLLVTREADTLAALRRLGAGCLLILEAKLPDAASEAILQAMASGPAPIACPVVLLSGPPVETRSPNVVGRPPQALRADPHARGGEGVLPRPGAPSLACSGFRPGRGVNTLVSQKRRRREWLERWTS